MGLVELLIVAVGLSLDAFAVAVGKGLSLKTIGIKNAGIIGLYFGVAQAVMPILGYFLGVQFAGQIRAYDHWVAFVLLSLIGLNMIREARRKTHSVDTSVGFKRMIVLAVATSIDALAVGISFAFLQVNIILAALLIGVVTLLLSLIGVGVGNAFGLKYRSKAEWAGGLILIGMGVKILLEHLGVISF